MTIGNQTNLSKKRMTCQLVDFGILADHFVKGKESKKKKKINYLTLPESWRTEKLYWN